MCSADFSRDSKLSIRYIHMYTLIRANLPCPPLRQGRDCLPCPSSQGRALRPGDPHTGRGTAYIELVTGHQALSNETDNEVFGVSIEALSLSYFFMFGDRF